MTAGLAGHGPVDSIVCDIDGVILLGKEAVPGARETLEQLHANELPIVFATNNSTRTQGMVRKLIIDVVGFDPGPDAVVNSGAAAAELIAGEVGPVFVVGTDGLRETLGRGGVAVTRRWQEADAVVVGLDPDVTYDVLAQAGLAIQNGAAFYATNDDVSYPQPDGLYPGAGAMVAAVVTTTGVEPVATCGKPNDPMRQALRRRVGKYPLIIGDRPETDLAIGKREGWKTVLTLTGVIKDPSEVPVDLIPDVVVDSIAELPDLLGL